MTTISASSTIGVVLTSPPYANPVVIDPGVTISSSGDGVYANTEGWTIQNYGSIVGTSLNSFGVNLAAGGSVTNAASALITGYVAVQVTGVAGTVANDGTIRGAGGDDINLLAGGEVINEFDGAIGSPSANSGGVYISGVPGTVINAGTINVGVWLQTGGTVTNQSDGTIISDLTSGGYGVGLYAGGTVTNAGQISGLQVGVSAYRLGGTVVNQTRGTITGKFIGVLMGFPGQTIGGGGNLINQAGGTISGDSGVVAGGSSATVTNAGIIMGTFAGTVSASGTRAGVPVVVTGVVGPGVSLGAGGTVTNQSGGSITGASYGVEISNGAGTVVNAGSIIGSGGTAVGLPGGYVDSVVVDPGAVFVGTVNGGNTIGSSLVSTLELMSYASAGTLSGLGTQFIDFAQVTVDGGANWMLTGYNTIATRETLTNSGTLTIGSGATLSGSGLVSGPVENDGQIIASGRTLEVTGSIAATGLLQIADNSILRLDAAPAIGQSVTFGAGSELILNAPGTAFNGAVTGLETGDTIEFGNGMTITSASVVNSTTIAVNFNGSGGLPGTYDLTNVGFAADSSQQLSVGVDASTGDDYIEVQPSSSNPVVVTTNFLFVDGLTGLWSVNETTSAAAELEALPGVAETNNIFAGSGKAWITAIATGSPSSDGTQLWVSTGTAQGTRLAVALPDNPNNNEPFPGISTLVPLSNGNAVFNYNDGIGNNGNGNNLLYLTDGTAPGTAEVTGISGSVVLPISGLATEISGAFLFLSSNGFWSLNETTGAATLVQALNIGGDFFANPGVAIANGKAFFSATAPGSNSTAGTELWVSNGTAQGTSLVTTLPDNTPVDGQDTAGIYNIVALSDGKVLFTYGDGTSPYTNSLYLSDGTSQGTVKVSGYSGTAYLSVSGQATELDGNYLFVDGTGLWSVNETTGAASNLASLNGAVTQLTMVVADGEVWFQAIAAGSSAEFGTQLWVSNGTAQGTRLVTTLPDTPASDSDPIDAGIQNIVPLANGNVAISYIDGNNNEFLYESDGTAQGTTLVAGFSGGQYPGLPFDGAAEYSTVTVTPQSGQTVSLDQLVSNPTIASNGTIQSLLLDGPGTVSVSGAVSINTLEISGGQLLLSGGKVSTDPVTVDAQGDISGYGTITGALTNLGTITANGGTLELTGSVTGIGSLVVDPGATLLLDLGASSGAVTVNAGAVIAAGELDVGETGLGGLLVENQATVVTGTIAVNGARGLDISETTDGTGDAIVTGSKSLLTNTGEFVVGDDGLGSLSIQSDGTVVTTPGTVAGLAGAVVANQSGAGGSSVNVTGAGSDWQVGGALIVGNADTGVLAITNGASVSATTLDVGDQTSGAGVVTVSGPDADLVTTGTVSIGDAGSGELSILDGANANIGGDLNVANAGTGTGNVDIEDTTGTIIFGGNILVGFNGFGVFNVGFNVDYIQNNGGIIFGPDSSGAINSFADPSPFLSNSSPSPISIGAQGVDQLAAYLFNSGEFTIPNNHSLTFDTPIISGGGSFALGSGDSLVLNADTVTGQTFTLGSNDKLTIGIDQLATIDLPASGTGPFTPEANPNKGDLLLGNFGGVIANFTSGDTIDVDTYLSSASAGTLSQNGALVSVIEIANGATLGVLRFDTAANAAAAIADDAITLVPCFAAGTRIATAQGEVAVEAIEVGERVRVLLGGGVAGDGFSEVIWVGRREIECTRHLQPRKVWPVWIAAGAFGPGRPHHELFLSPDHAVYINDVLIPIKHLINGSTIVQVPVQRVTYHHIELAEHNVLLAEGLPAESFLDMRDGSNYANRPGPTRLYPDFSVRMWEAFGCARLVVTGPKLEAARVLVAGFASVQKAA